VEVVEIQVKDCLAGGRQHAAIARAAAAKTVEPILAIHVIGELCPKLDVLVREPSVHAKYERKWQRHELTANTSREQGPVAAIPHH
jgi:hypothetical protein